MSYIVLARKYRSRNFSEMVGQAHVVQALSNALTSQRLHHAYLFTGTRGVGKTTVSRILAKALNCTGPDGQGGITATPCGVCPSCTDIDSGRFVDYTELDAASNRGVDEVQALLEQAVYKPVQGRFKVFMIDEVHMLSNTAFNAMLKTLEEPPEYLKFVLATTDPQKVPVTVLSRCLQFNLRPMAPETILEHLTHILAQEGVAADEQALRLIARAARGSMRDALSLTDQAIAYGSGALGEASVRQMLGSVDKSYVFRLLQALAEADGRAVVQTVDQLRQQGVAAASTLDEMTQALQRMAVLQLAPDASNTLEPDAEQLAALARALPADETQLLYSLCLQGRGELGLAPDEYAALTMVLLRLLAFKTGGSAVHMPAADPAEKKSPLDTGIAPPRGPQPTPVPAPAPVAAAAPRPPTFSQPRATGPQGPAVQVAAPPVAAHLSAAPAKTTASRPVAPAPEPAVPTTPPGLALPVRDWMGGDAAQARVPDDLPPWESASDEAPRQAPGAWLEVPVRDAPDTGVLDREPAAQLADIPPSEQGDFWSSLIEQMDRAGRITGMPRELAMQAQLIARDTDQWQLRVDKASLNHAGSRDKLEKALAEQGHGVRLAIEVGRVIDTPAKRQQLRANRWQQQAESLIRNDVFVQQMERDFGAKIAPGSIRIVA